MPLTGSGGTAGHPPAPEERVASDSIARNTAFATVTAALSVSFAVVLTLYLVRALSPQGYGTYTLALAVGSLVGLAMDFGISSSAGRFIAERRGDRQAIALVRRRRAPSEGRDFRSAGAGALRRRR